MEHILPVGVESLPSFVSELVEAIGGKDDYVSVIELLIERIGHSSFLLSKQDLDEKYSITNWNKKYFHKVFYKVQRGNNLNKKMSEYAIIPRVRRELLKWYRIEGVSSADYSTFVATEINRYVVDGKLFKSRLEVQECFNMSKKGVEKMKLEKKQVKQLLSTREPFMPSGGKPDFNHPVRYNKQAVESFISWFNEEVDIDLFSATCDLDVEGNSYFLIMKASSNTPFKGAYYKRHAFGRLFGFQDKLYHFNWQGMNRIARSVAFDGYYEYDINSAAPCVLIQYAAEHGMGNDWPYIKMFIENKDFFRNGLADILEIEYKGAKRALTALFFGSRLPNTFDRFRETKMYKLIHEYSLDKDTDMYFDRVIELLETSVYGGLVQEIQQLFNKVSSDMYRRADGKNYYFKDGQKLSKSAVKSKNALVAAVYQHEEAKILEALMENYSYELLLHDAFISQEDYEVDSMSAYVKAKTGYDLVFEKTLIKDDFTHRLEKYKKTSS